MKKKRVSIRVVALAVTFILAFTPLGAYAGEQGQEPAPQAGEGEAPGPGGEYEETPGADTPDNPGEGDAPGDNGEPDSPGDGDEEPEASGDGNGEEPLESENLRANTALPLGSPVMPTNYTNTITDVANLQVEINKIIGHVDKKGTITLDNSSGTAELANTVTPVQIEVDTEIRLRSDNPLTLTVDNGRHFKFDIASGATLTLYLDDITLEGGADKGGIENIGAGALSLQSGIVTNCRYSSDINGGGVYTGSGNVEIGGSTVITGNKAESGGGVSTWNGNVTISSSAQISGNKANDGGGVYAWNGNVEIKDSAQISGNTAGNYGGGVYAWNGNVEIKDSAQISGNKANDGGGVFALGKLEISGSAQITDNEATQDGGAVIGSYVEISGSAQITRNTATVSGGGVYAGSVGIGGRAQISGNEATNGDGGGVYAGGKLEISGSAQITGNKAESGGGVYAWGELEIKDSAQITDNEATNGSGGGVYAEGNVEIRDSAQITGNKAESGGGVYAWGKLEISGSAVIDRNTAGADGGGFYAKVNVEIKDSAQITGNEASNGFGGGFYARGNVEISGREISDNIAGRNGGGFYAAGKVEIGGSAQITGNEASNGGGFYAENNVEIKDNAQITGNEASNGFGGGVLAAGKVEIKDNAQISGNEASSGGGVYAWNGNVEIKDNAQITGNKASSSGGVYAGGKVEIKDNAQISGNEATNGSGGGVLANDKVEIKDSAQISGNTAGADGGGVYAGGKVEIKDSAQISGNTAGADGGGVWALSGNNITVTGGSFKGNLAGSGGYWITGIDETSAPYDTWSSYTSVSKPFTHIANNFDIVYTPSAETPVHVAAFSMNDGSYEDFLRIEITSPGAPLDNFPAAPVRDGFDFTGWNENADGSGGSVTEDYSFTTTQWVYAQWEIRSVNPEPPRPPLASADDDRDSDGSGSVTYVIIKFNTGGGSAVKSVFAAVKSTLKLPADPVREGYIFTGWYTDAALKKIFSPDTVITRGMTLYAGWELAKDTEPAAEYSQAAVWQNIYADIHESDWYYEDVAYVNENGLMTGISQEQFSPGSRVTRGMAAAILWRLSGRPAPAGTPAFADLSQDWYRDAVAWASEAEIAAGYSPFVFGPEDAITREQLAVMLYNYARYIGLDVNVQWDLSSYADSYDISGYALEAIIWANNNGYISGRSQSELVPKGITTRAEMAAILHRFMEDAAEE